MGLLGAAEQELIIKTEDVVSNNDVGVFLLDKFGPFQKNRLLRLQLVSVNNRDCLNGRTLHRRTSAQHNAMVQIRLGTSVVQESGTNHCHWITLQWRKHFRQYLVNVFHLLVSTIIVTQHNINDRIVLGCL